MRIILRRKVIGTGQDAEQMVRSALAHLTDKIFIESVDVKNDSEGSQLITLNYRSQGASQDNLKLDSLVRAELAMRGDFEVIQLDRPPVFFGMDSLLSGLEEPMLSMGRLGRVREKQDDTQSRHYEPLHVQREREENYTRKTLVKFSIGFHPKAVSDDIAFSVRTILFNAIFSLVGTPCLNHRELYERNALNDIMTIGCSFTFFTNKIDDDTLKKRLLELQKSIPGVRFINDAVEVVSERLNAQKQLIFVEKPMYILQGWDAVGKQVLSESFYETDASAMQPQNSETRRYERDAIGRITKITFEYANPEVECCELSSVHIMRLPALKSVEQQDGSTKYEVNMVFLSVVVADAAYRRSLLNGSISLASVEYAQVPNEEGNYKVTGSILTTSHQKQVTPADTSNPYNYFATLIEENESLREDCAAGLVTQIVLTKSKTNEISANVSGRPKFKLILGVEKKADPAVVKTALSKLERFISIVSIKPTEECVQEGWQNFCVYYALQPNFDPTTHLVMEFQTVANAEKLRLFTLQRPLQIILAPAIKMTGQEGDVIFYGVAVNLFKALASDEKLRHSLLKGDIVEVRMVFQEVSGQADSFTYTGKLNCVSQGNQPTVLNAQNLYTYVARAIEYNQELRADILEGRLTKLIINRNANGDVTLSSVVAAKTAAQIAQLN